MLIPALSVNVVTPAFALSLKPGIVGGVVGGVIYGVRAGRAFASSKKAEKHMQTMATNLR